jgi:hypothetical protein
MPQELKQVNGRWVVTGAQQSSDLAPTGKAGFKPAAPKPQARPAPRAQAAPARRAPRPWWSKLINDIQYEVKASPIGALNTQLNLGVAGAGDNLARMAYSLAQRHVQKKPKADPSSGRVGNLLDQLVDHQYRRLGAKPPSQMSQAERGVDQMRRSVVGNLLVAPLTPGFGFASATTTAGQMLRGGAAFAFNEALSTIVDDSTGGNIVNMINPKLPLAVNVGVDDMVDAYVKSIIPNAATSLAVGGAVGGAASMFKNIRRNTRAHRAVQQEVRQRAKQESMGVLQKDEADGLDFTPQAKQPAQPAPAPEPTFQEANAAMEERLGMRQPQAAPEPAAAAPEPAPIPTIENATTEDFGKAQAAELPDADPSIDYWDYDPDLPESTALGKTLEELSDNELQTVLSTPDAPVVERVNQTIEARAGVEPRPPVAAQMVMAPTDRLADDYLETVTRKLGAREDYELRPLFDPEVNPGLWQRAQALTGVDDAAQLSKADMLDSLNAMAADGQAPIVNRMMGGQMLPTGEVQAAPLVFQYKGGVNDAGEQIGNSLEGLERWDPNAEGILQVWRDVKGEIGKPGIVYVVNGHNRLAAAKRLGIPSIRVEYLDAPTAAEARLQGAISNVSDGKGTVFDAAKLAREYGINDPAQLKAMGKPGASGFWKEGIALGRLPEDVFTAAVNGQLGETVRKAVIIGESGANEETMRSAYRYLVQQGPDNVKEGTLREMLAMAQSSPAASSSGGRQKVLFEGTEWEQSFNEGMLAKADLAAAVRQMLSKEKKLFGTVGRQAGQIERVGQVDAAAAKDISGEASRALTIFDELKYMAGPVGDLLNEGTQRILAGESAAQVAKGIKNRLAASIAEAMGKEVAPAVDVVQEDMFAAATRAAEPIELTPDERLAAEAQLLQQAAANGEIRPPTAPIPDLPEPAQVRLDSLDEAKLPQATADEIRLAVEHKQSDAALAFEQQQALRDGTEYEALTFDEKKDLGLAADLDEAITPEVLPPESKTPIADAFGATLRAMAESDARLFREIDQLTQTTRRAIDELAGPAAPARPVRPEPLRLTASAEQPEFVLPKELSKAAPRYGRATIRFESDLDRTAYVLANDAVKPSKAAGKFREALEAAGMDVAEVTAHGKKVKAALKQAARGLTPGEPIQLPAQPWRPSRSGGTQRVASQSLEKDLAAAEGKLEGLLREFVATNRLNRSEVTARMSELMDGLRQIVGKDVRIRILDTYKIDKPSTAWGGGNEMADVAGVYQVWKDTIHLWRQVGEVEGIGFENSFDELIGTGFHESFHRIVRLAMPDKDMAVLNTPLARLKAALAMDDWGGDQSRIAYDELLTEAAARVFSARFKGEDPVRAILPKALGITDDISTTGPNKVLYKAAETIVRALNKVYDVIERTYNLFQGRGFESISSVFDKAARGEMTGTIDALRPNRATLAYQTMPGIARSSKVRYWESYNVFGAPIVEGGQPVPNFKQGLFDVDYMNQPPPTKAGINRVRQQIEANNQSINDIRRKAQQEGC